MFDEADKSNEEYQKLVFTNTLLNLYRIYLILRNLTYDENSEIENGKKVYKDYEYFEDTASRLSQFPLYFSPSEEINNLLTDWSVALSEFIPSSSDRFNLNILVDEENSKIISKVTNEINEFYANRPNINKSSPDKALFKSSLDPKFESIKLTYRNGLDQQKLKIEIDKTKQELKTVIGESSELKQTISDFKETHTSFNAFVEKNYNDETKKIYDEIFKSENKLANNYRNYAIAVFFSIGGIAIISFVLPSIIGVINYFKINEFKTPEANFFFFVKSVFMLLLTAPGWYFARESAKHRQVAYKAKIISSELTALPYYLADLDLKDRHEMRMKMADKFFGQELYNDKKSDSSNVSEQTKATTEAIKTINALLSKPNKPGEGT